MAPSLFSSILLTLATLQSPGTRLTYRVRVLEHAAVAPRLLASGAASGSFDTDMRLTLRTDTAEVEAVFQVTPIGDTVNLGAEFFTRRRVGRSRRGLPLWEEDTYRRVVRLAWSDTARIYPFGAPSSSRGNGNVRGMWVELILERLFTGGVGRPAEEFSLVDSTRVFRLSRSVAQGVVVMDYVEAARLRGEKLPWIMRREILPNIMPPLVAEFGLRFCFVFLTISALSFLGLGIQPPTADWGSMVRDNAALITYGDITPLLPAGAIALLTVSVNFVVDWFLHKTSGLRE